MSLKEREPVVENSGVLGERQPVVPANEALASTEIVRKVLLSGDEDYVLIERDGNQIRVLDIGNAFVEPEEILNGFRKMEIESGSTREQVALVFPDYPDQIQAEGDDVQEAKIDYLRLFNRVFDKKDNGYEKSGLLGFPWVELVSDKGLGIAERSIWEGKSWPEAVAMMYLLRSHAENWFNGLPGGPLEFDELPIVDFGTGSGATASAARVKFSGLRDTSILTIEREQLISSLAFYNFQSLGIDKVRFMDRNIVDFMRSQRLNGHQMSGYPHGASLQDMPWRSAKESADVFVKSMNDLFLLSNSGSRLVKREINDNLHLKRTLNVIEEDRLKADSVLNGEEIMALTLRNISPVVATHLPNNVKPEAIRKSAENIGAHTVVYNLSGTDNSRVVNTVFVVMWVPYDQRDKLSFDVENIETDEFDIPVGADSIGGEA